MRSQAAFTLMEMLVTLALAAVLMGFGVPAFKQYSLNLQLKRAASQLHADLHRARQEAVIRNQRVILCPGTPAHGCSDGPSWSQGWLAFADHNGDRDWQEEEPLLSVAARLAPLTARSSQARSRLAFFPNGTAPGSNVTVYLCDGRGPARGVQVRLSMSGQARIVRPDRDEASGC